MSVDGCASGEFVAAMQSSRIGHAYFDPGGHPPGQIPTQNGRFVASRNAFSQGYSVAVFEAIGKDPHQHVLESFGGMSRDAKVELFVDAAINVREINTKVVYRRCLRHQALSI